MIAYGIAALALLGGLWVVNGWRKDAAKLPHVEAAFTTYRATAEKQARLFALQQEKDQRADQALASRLSALESDNTRLRRLLAGVKPTVEKTDASGRTCPVASDAWGVCVTAQVSRDPTHIAACEAAAGNASVSSPVNH